MKGYVFTASEPEAVREAAVCGNFAVALNYSKKAQKDPAVLNTPGADGRRSLQPFDTIFKSLADFTTVSAGDAVFFFSKRHLYGIGRVVGSRVAGPASFLNYPSALDWPLPDEPVEPEQALSGNPVLPTMRVVVAFEPVGEWFLRGIDMDDVLSTPGVEVAQGLRLMSGKSFHQLGHDETIWLASQFLRRLGLQRELMEVTATQQERRAKTLASIRNGAQRPLSCQELVARGGADLVDKHGQLLNEALLHALVVECIRAPSSEAKKLMLAPHEHLELRDVFHEYWGSPPKASLWADRIDILATFGVSQSVAGVHEYSPSFWDIYELKAKPADGESSEALLTQGLKYTDFVARQLAGRNYDAIRLTMICHRPRTPKARDSQGALVHAINQYGRRQYTLGTRLAGAPPSRDWSAVRLLNYWWDGTQHALRLVEVTE